jgi:hypothetical protein
MWDYARLYLKTDVLFLVVVFEGFRDMAIREYGLDPAWSFSAPGLSWDAMLKFTGIYLELITDPDMHLMFTKRIRGGNCMVVTRYAEANFKGMGDAYDREKENSYFRDWDKNNLYGGAMSENLPYAEFRWMDDEELENWEQIPCVVEVDLRYPESLHALHNDYPLASEVIKIGNVNKLVCNLNNKEKYFVHHELLKFYVSLGLKITKVHRGIAFKEGTWMKPYVDKNMKCRILAKSKAETNFFKSMDNAAYGKTLENVRNRVDDRLVTFKEQFNNVVKKTNYGSCTIFSENLVS